jgi:flagellar hook-associated protein 1 FlgK
MSLTGALSAALSGLQTSTAAAQLISTNIANSQTLGYSKKSLELAPVVTGAGAGVQIVGYTRASDTILSATLNSATCRANYYSTQNSYLTQVQAILDSTGNPPTLSNDLSNFQAAWTSFASNPSDETLERTIVSAGQKLSNTINGIGEQITELQRAVENDLSTSITSLNEALKTVESYNILITKAISNNQPTGDLEDQRDIAVNEVAKFTNVTVMQREYGQVALYTQNGTILLDGTAQTFYLGSGSNTILNNTGSDVTASLSGGSLDAQAEFLATTPSSASGTGVIEKLKSQIQNFANLFIATTSNGNSFADVYNGAAADSTDQPSDFFTALTDDNGLPDLATFAVNVSLVDGTTTIKSAAASIINDAFCDADRAITTTYDAGSDTYTYTTSTTFSSTGLTAQRQTYSGIVTAILSGFQQAANAVKSQYATASTQQSYYQSALASSTGVNTDAELVALTNWENSYAASAHVISTIQSMMKTLEDLVS